MSLNRSKLHTNGWHLLRTPCLVLLALLATAPATFALGFDSEPACACAGTDARTYAYDVLDRLTHMASSHYGNETFVYDPLGNVRSRALGVAAIAALAPLGIGGTTGVLQPDYTSVDTYHYDPATNRISQINTTAYGHDTRGNVTSIGSFALNWNRANELTSDGFGTSYAYDARGWRVKKVVDAAHSSDSAIHTRYFIYDSAHRLMERWDNGEVTDFVTVGSLPIARIKANTPTYLQANYQNSPLFETNSAGQILHAPAFAAYGLPANSDATPGTSGATPNYTGATRDPATGLLYLGARYQNATRFLSPDPAGLSPMSPGGLNRYAYADDNPARYTDPEGRCTGANASCGIMVQSVGGAILKSGSTRLSPIAKVGLGVMLSATGVGEVAGLIRVAVRYVGFRIASAATHKASTVTRYMGPEEAKVVARSGEVPNTGKDGILRPTHVTTDAPVTSAAKAQERYELPSPPTHSATVPASRVSDLGPTPDGRSITSGGGSQNATNRPIAVKPDEINRLDH